MKKNKILLTLAIAVFGFLFLMQGASAASKTYQINGSVPAFGGKYEKWIYEDSVTENSIKYIKINIYAHDGNKLKVGFLHTEDYPSHAKLLDETGTLQAKSNNYAIYLIAANGSCPSNADACLRAPKSVSTDGRGDDISYDFMTGIRFTNESWFYGNLYIEGSYTLYY